MRIVYGPIASWRLGISLGVDLICSPKKICSFDCNYCQIEGTEEITSKRDIFVSINKMVKELKYALKHVKPDVITFSGMGEPTLAKNLDKAIEAIKQITNLPLAILTNSSLLYTREIQDTLVKLDIIVAKLDAPNQKIFDKISRPAKGINFEQTIKGIKRMRKIFHGKFALQIMFMNENKNYVKNIVEIVREISPSEVQINTPLRPCYIDPLSENELDEIEKLFFGLNTISVYHSKKPVIEPIDKLELIKRRMEL